MNYVGTPQIIEFPGWIVVDIDNETKVVKILRISSWFNQVNGAENALEYNTKAYETVRKDNKYYNPRFVESPEKVTPLTVEDVKRNTDGSFYWNMKVPEFISVGSVGTVLAWDWDVFDENAEVLYGISDDGLVTMYGFNGATFYMRAVVELKPNVIVTSGDGTSSSEFEIDIIE